MPSIRRETVRVAAVQSRIDQGDTTANWERATALLRPVLAAEPIDLVVFPEAFVSGVNFIILRQLAEAVPNGPTTTALCELASSHRVHVVAGVLEAGDDGAVYDSAVVIDDAGQVVGHYRRRYVWVGERNYITGGDLPGIVDTRLGRLGLLVGYDLCFPQAAADFLAHDVDLIVCSASVFEQLNRSAPALALARAADSHCYAVYANAVGFHQFANLAYTGGSGVFIDPYFVQVGLREPVTEPIGVLASADGVAPTVVTAPLCLADLQTARASNLLPFQADATFRSPVPSAR
jgi:predicted amidohydrolase